MVNIEYKIKLLHEDDLYNLYEQVKWNEILKLDKEELINAINNRCKLFK